MFSGYIHVYTSMEDALLVSFPQRSGNETSGMGAGLGLASFPGRSHHQFLHSIILQAQPPPVFDRLQYNTADDQKPHS